MSFEPFHKFQNNIKLESLINDFINRKHITNDVINGFQRYHSALIYKLKCAKYYHERLVDKLTKTNIQEATTMASDFIFETNMYIDGFFYAGGSSLDILAREIIIYFGQPLPNKVYFQTANQILSKARPNDPILNRLDDPSWRKDFSTYRNTLTHELIVATNYQINISMDSGSPSYNIAFPLPDDPRSDPASRTYKKNVSVILYTKEHLCKLLKLINIIYGDIHNRASINKQLPI